MQRPSLPRPGTARRGVLCSRSVDLPAVRHIHIARPDDAALPVAKEVGQFAAEHHPSVLPVRMRVRRDFLTRMHAPDGDARAAGHAQLRDRGFVRGEADGFEGVEDALAHAGESLTAQCL